MNDIINVEAAKGLKALLCSFYPADYKEFYRFLSPSIVEKIQEIPFKEKVDVSHLFSSQRWIETIHYSWFLPFLESLQRNILPTFLSLFPADEKFELKKLLKMDAEKKPAGFLRTYLLNLMFNNLGVEKVLPIDLLPFSDLNSLISLSKKEVILLIDLLGIYDLAYEMRQIVDKNLINKVHGALSREELLFLSFASKQSFKWIPPKLNIASWDGDTKKLKTLLHYRGLSRLAQGSILEDENFKWHLSHLLDIGRGKALLKLYAGKYDPAMIPYFKGQVLDIVKRFPK